MKKRDEGRRVKGVVALGKLVPRVAPLNKEQALLGQLLGKWPAICPALAAWSRPLGVKDGVLRVAVASDPVKQELGYLSTQIIMGCNVLLGFDGVSKVVGVTSAWDRAPKKPKPVRPSALAVEKAAGKCSQVKDDALKDALARLGSWVVEPKKT